METNKWKFNFSTFQPGIFSSVLVTIAVIKMDHSQTYQLFKWQQKAISI